ncbi:MAG TPA: hypothetical protein VJV79_18670 [Polyangiaceae bacterium]|nr:hypothetical protein [Polyangiaceae bacterium]
MGMQLNLGDHIAKDRALIAIPSEYRADARWARSQARAISYSKAGANVYFRSLPGKRTLTGLLEDRSIWVSYTTSPVMGSYYLLGNFHEIGLGYYAFRAGRRTLLGVLIHELAHANGAPDTTSQAEDALVHCGLGTLAELKSGVDDPSTPYLPRYKG